MMQQTAAAAAETTSLGKRGASEEGEGDAAGGGADSSSKKSNSSSQIHGENWEEGMRLGLKEVMDQRGHGEVVEGPFKVLSSSSSDSGRTLGDLDAYVVLNADARLGDLLPTNALLNATGLDNLDHVFLEGTGIIFEASSSWDHKKEQLPAKDTCFAQFAREKPGKKKWFVVFMFNGADPRNTDLLEGATLRAGFLKKRTNTVFAWCSDRSVLSWQVTLRLKVAEASRIASEDARIASEEARIASEEARIAAEQREREAREREREAQQREEAERAKRVTAEEEIVRLRQQLLLAQAGGGGGSTAAKGDVS